MANCIEEKLLKLKEELQEKMLEREKMLSEMQELSTDEIVKKYTELGKTDKVRNYIDLERECNHLYKWIENTNDSIMELEQRFCKHPVLFYIGDVSRNYIEDYKSNSSYIYYICLNCLKRFQTIIHKEDKKKMVGLNNRYNTEEDIEYYLNKYREFQTMRKMTNNDIVYELQNIYDKNNKQKVK